jgi:hypothetical protein
MRNPGLGTMLMEAKQEDIRRQVQWRRAQPADQVERPAGLTQRRKSHPLATYRTVTVYEEVVSANERTLA